VSLSGERRAVDPWSRCHIFFAPGNLPVEEHPLRSTVERDLKISDPEIPTPRVGIPTPNPETRPAKTGS